MPRWFTAGGKSKGQREFERQQEGRKRELKEQQELQKLEKQVKDAEKKCETSKTVSDLKMAANRLNLAKSALNAYYKRQNAKMQSETLGAEAEASNQVFKALKKRGQKMPSQREMDAVKKKVMKDARAKEQMDMLLETVEDIRADGDDGDGGGTDVMDLYASGVPVPTHLMPSSNAVDFMPDVPSRELTLEDKLRALSHT